MAANGRVDDEALEGLRDKHGPVVRVRLEHADYVFRRPKRGEVQRAIGDADATALMKLGTVDRLCRVLVVHPTAEALDVQIDEAPLLPLSFIDPICKISGFAGQGESEIKK